MFFIPLQKQRNGNNIFFFSQYFTLFFIFFLVLLLSFITIRESHQCKQAASHNELEQRYLNATHFEIFTNINRVSLNQFSFYNKFIRSYNGSSVQFFDHYDNVEAYACNGPYIQDWMKGAASWHPSKIAHRFRASRVAYLWLAIWKYTLDDLLILLDQGLSPQLIMMEIDYRLNSAYQNGLPPKIFNTNYTDNSQCLTNYEPRLSREVSLKDSVLEGLRKEPVSLETEESEKMYWKFDIYENIVSKNIIVKARESGYIDFKYTLYAPYGNNSGPISIYVSPLTEGTVSYTILKIFFSV